MLAAPNRTAHNLDGRSGTSLPHLSTESHPPFLSAPEERKLAERIKAGDRLAQDQLVLAHRRLVFRIVREYKTRGISRDDLIQEGSMGLIRAAQNFDPSTYGFRFSTYARFWIRAFIQRAISSDGSLVRVLASPGGSPAQLQTAENDLLVQEDRAAVYAALRRLSPFEAWVICERFGLLEWCSNPTDSSKRRKKAKAALARSWRSSGAKKAAHPGASYYSRTHDKLSRDCGLSVHRVRLVEKAALDKLRSFLSPVVGHGLPPRHRSGS
jgi:RNA polymerase sigma factor (sigma-70 family)